MIRKLPVAVVAVALVVALLVFPHVASAQGRGRVNVKGYHRKDGTYVQPHTRSYPGTGASSGPASSGSYSSPAPAGQPSSPTSIFAPPTATSGTRLLSSADITAVDGDTFYYGGKRYRIVGIDTPEAGEAGYEAAKHRLAQLLASGAVEVQQVGVDVYGRPLVRVLVNGEDIAAILRREGHQKKRRAVSHHSSGSDASSQASRGASATMPPIPYATRVLASGEGGFPILPEEQIAQLIQPLEPEGEGQDSARPGFPAPPVAAPENEVAQAHVEILQRYNGWKDAWSRMNLEAYLSFYSPQARIQRADGEVYGYHTLRQRMAEQWARESFIRLHDLSPPYIRINGNRAVLTVEQQYQSSSWGDAGSKTLIWERVNGQWLITNEQFKLHGPVQHGAVQKAPVQGSEQNARVQAPQSNPAYPGEKFGATRYRHLSPEEVSRWSDTQIQYAINEMYARHGLDFSRPEVKRLFERFPWYRPVHGRTEAEVAGLFNAYERANLRVIVGERGRR